MAESHARPPPATHQAVVGGTKHIEGGLIWKILDELVDLTRGMGMGRFRPFLTLVTLKYILPFYGRIDDGPLPVPCPRCSSRM